MKRKCPKRNVDRDARAGVERLEPRRLLMAILDFDATTAILTLYDNTNGVDSGITLSTVSAGGPVSLQISEGGEAIFVSPAAQTIGWSNGADMQSAVGPDDGTVKKIEILTGDGNDGVQLQGAAGGTGFAPPSIDVSSNGNADVTIRRAAIPQSLGNVALHNNGGQTTVSVDDSTDTTPRTVTATSSAITGLLDNPVAFDGTVSDITLLAGTGGDTFIVQGTPPPGTGVIPAFSGFPTSFLTIRSIDNDSVDVQASGARSLVAIGSNVPTATENVLISDHGSVQNILGRTVVDSSSGVQGIINLTIDASADNIPQVATISTDPDPQFEDGSVDGIAGDGVQFNQKYLGQLTIKTGAGADQIAVEQHFGPTNGTTSTAIDTGAGNDTINVFSTPVGGTLAMDGQGGQDKVNVFDFQSSNGTVLPDHTILGQVDIADTGGSVAVAVDGSAGHAGRTVRIGDGGVLGLTTAPISFTDNSRIDVIGSTASDAFSVDPRELSPVHVDGGPFTSVGGSVAADMLTVDLTFASGVTVTAPNVAAGTPGEFSFTNLPPIFFSRFATVSPAIGSIGGSVVNGDGLAPVVGAIVFIDSNGNHSPDAGEPTTSTDAMGAFLFDSIMAGTYTVVQVAPAGLVASTPATMSATVTLGAAAPVNFVDVHDPSIPLTGSIAGSVTNGASPTPIAGAVVFIDSNGNGNPDAGEPTTSTDATGAFHFDSVVVGTYNLVQVVPTGLIASTLATVSATVTSGEAAPVKFVDLPAPTPGGPDLTDSFVGAFPTSVLTGAKSKGKLRIVNQGAALTSSGLQVALFTSSDSAFNAGDSQFATLSTGPLKLKAGGSKVISIQFTYPSGIADGNYFIIASVDATNQVMESDESNNTTAIAGAVTISAPFVDLAGKFGRLPSTLTSGKTVSLPLTIQNLGNIAATGTIAVDVFASADTALDASDKSLSTGVPVKINAKPGKSQNVQLHIPANPSVAPGSYFLIVNVNSTQTLSEKNPANNVVVSGLPILLN